MTNQPRIMQLLDGLMGTGTPRSREETLEALHRCDNPACVIRQIIVRDGEIIAKAVASIPGTLTEDKDYVLTGQKGGESWCTVDDEGVRFVGVLGRSKEQDPGQEKPNQFYIGDEQLELYRQSLPEKEGRGNHGKEEVKLTLAQAFDEFVTNEHTGPVFEQGEVIRVRPGFYTSKLNHGIDWPVIVVNSDTDYVEDNDGEFLTQTILIVDPRDGEVTYNRVNGVRYELAPAAEQITAQAKAKATKVQGEQ